MRAEEGLKPDGSAASRTSTRQWAVSGVAQLTYIRHLPSGSATSVGRSSESQRKTSRLRTATVSNCSPSSDRATTLA